MKVILILHNKIYSKNFLSTAVSQKEFNHTVIYLMNGQGEKIYWALHLENVGVDDSCPVRPIQQQKSRSAA